MEPSHPTDPLQQLRDDVLERKRKQNARRAKAGKKPMHPGLDKPKKKRASRRAGKLPAPESGDEEDTALSFDEWKACGYTVKKGEKSQLQDIHGVPQFLRSQIHRINPAWEKYRQRS